MHALLDIGTHALLALDPYPPVLTFLSEAIPDSYHEFGVDKPAYAGDRFLVTLKPAEYPAWTWDIAARRFAPAPADIRSAELDRRSALAIAKARTAGALITGISFIRGTISTGILFQEVTYLRKMREAERLKERGFVVENPMEFPHVMQYADYAGISHREAAERILFRAQLDDQLLARSDILRIQYFDRLKKAATPEEADAVAADFRRDTRDVGRI